MAPPYQLQVASTGGLLHRGHSREQSGSDIVSQDAPLASSDDDTGIRIDPEVEFFANALDDCLSPAGSAHDKRARLIRLIQVYRDATAIRVESLHRSVIRNDENVNHGDNDMDLDEADDRHDSDVIPEELRRWEQEARIWDLLARLIPLRYPDAQAASREYTWGSFRGQPNGDLWQEFISATPGMGERASVLGWLQENAKSRPDINDLVKELQQNANRGDIVAHGWLHTNKAIKLRKSIHAWPHHVDPDTPAVSESLMNSDNAPLVTQLDPDSVSRQGRRLQPEDEYFERATWLGCFELLRRGSPFEAIKEWCLDRTEVWRAVSMSPWPAPGDDKESSADPDAESLALWRRMCYALASKGGTDDFERAVYGVLSGDILSVEAVCQSWDDFMFAHFNALLRTEFDNFLLNKCTPETSATLRQSFSTFDAVRFHGDAATVNKRLVETLESDSRTREEAMNPMSCFQAAIISQDLSRHFYQQGLVLAHHANARHPSKLIPLGDSNGIDFELFKFVDLGDHSGLRIMAHVFIVLSALDGLGTLESDSAVVSKDACQREVQGNLIAAYVSFLRLAGLEELIPLYCSKLDSPRLYEVLSRNLIHVTDMDGRLLQLNLIRKAGLDVLEFVKVQPKLIFGDVGDEQKASSAAGLFRIMDSGPRTIKYGRSVKTDFFGDDPDRIDHLDELLIRSVEWLLLVDEAWPDVFDFGTRVYKYFLRRLHLNAARALSSRVSFTQVMRQRLGQPVPEDLENAWFEDPDIWDSDLSIRDAAWNARNFWELESLVKALDTMETLASLAELSKEDPSAKRDFWTKVGNEVKAAKIYIRPLLKNWLLIGGQEDKELLALRDAFLPETLLAYASTLHFAGTSLSRDYLLEAMELAAVIAEKDSDIAACFVKANRMKELVEAFASCSKALAIAAVEKKGAGSTSKKLREMGWSRDLWSVRQ